MVNRFLVFGKQTYTREAAAIVFEIFRSITLQENTWTTRNKDSTQIYTDDEHLLALTSLTKFECYLYSLLSMYFPEELWNERSRKQLPLLVIVGCMVAC